MRTTVRDTHAERGFESRFPLQTSFIKSIKENLQTDIIFIEQNIDYFLIYNFYLHDNQLHILYPVLQSDHRPVSSILLEFDLSNGGAEWVRQYDFPDFVQRFCITDDYIYGFVPQSSSIKRYPLPA